MDETGVEAKQPKLETPQAANGQRESPKRRCKMAGRRHVQQRVAYAGGYQQLVRQYSVVIHLRRRHALGGGLSLGGRLVGMGRVEDEGHRDAGGAANQRQQGHGDVEIVDAPGAVACRVQLAAEEAAVGASGQNQRGGHAGRRDVEGDVGRQAHGSEMGGRVIARAWLDG